MNDDKVPGKKSRQGRQGLPALLILIGGLVLAGVVWAIVEIYGVFIDERQPTETEQSTEVPLNEPQGLENSQESQD